MEKRDGLKKASRFSEVEREASDTGESPRHHLQGRTEKIPGDKKRVESMLTQSHYAAQFNTNTARKLLSSARQVLVSCGLGKVPVTGQKR